MSRKRLITDNDYLNTEPYRSIIHILFLAPSFHPLYQKGVQPKELRTLLVKDYIPYPIRGEKHRRDILSQFRDYLSTTAVDRVCLYQEEIQPGRYTKKKNKPTTTRLENLFNQILQRLKQAGWIDRRYGYCFLSEKHTQKILQHWHSTYFRDSSEPSMVFHRQFVFYVPRNRPELNGSLLEDKQRTRIAEICDEVSQKFIEIDAVLEASAKKTAVSLCTGLIEQLKFGHPAERELLYICLITDFALGLHLTRYFTEKDSKESFTVLEPQKTVCDIILRSAKQYLKKRYQLTTKDLHAIVDAFNHRYYILHSFFCYFIYSMVRSSTSYVIVCERPILFMGNERPLLSPYDLKQLHTCQTFYQMKTVIDRIERKKHYLVNVQDFLTEKTKQDASIESLTISRQQHRPPNETTIREKTSFFLYHRFNREFTETLKTYGFHPDEIQRNAEEWSVLFNSY